MAGVPFEWSQLWLIGVLLMVVGYFLKKIGNRIEDTTREIVGLRINLAELPEILRKSTMESFDGVCKDRQLGCSNTNEAKRRALELKDSEACTKILALEKTRKKDWEEQKRWNEKIERKIYEKKGRR